MVNAIRKTVWVVGLLAVFVLPLQACNTMEGIGNDAQALGEAISGSATKSKAY